MPDFATDPHAQDTPAPAPGVLVADFFSQPPGYAVRRSRGTKDWLITCTISGQGRYELDGKTITCQPGDIVLLAPNTIHDYRTASNSAPWQFYWAHFIPRHNWMPWLALPEVLPGLRFYSLDTAEANRRIEVSFRRLLGDSAEKGPYQDELAQNALEEVLILITRERNAFAPPTIDPRIAIVQRYLDQHYHQPVSLPALAELASLSSWRLSHLFKEITGQTIMGYLTRQRLRQAARLLALTSRKVDEIAKDVGFESPYHFSRLFKKHYGTSPTEFRKTAQ